MQIRIPRVYLEIIRMKNIKTSVKDNVLTIRVKLDAKTSKSASGKSLIIASTQGNKPVDGADGVIIGLNIYRPVK